MSTINTVPKFWYNTKVEKLSFSIDFSEGGPELRASLTIGSYSATEFISELAKQMNIVGGQVYSVTLNRTTREITISATSNFSLLTNTGSRLGSTAYITAGFSTAANYTGASTYTGTLKLGKEYVLQYRPFEYISLAHSLRKEMATVNTTASGFVQQISFNETTFFQLNIKPITEKNLKNSGFVYNSNGISDYIDFIKYLLTKAKVEFMEDKDAPNVFDKCFLEGNKDDKNARIFNLRNITKDIYESGILEFRKVD